MIMHNCTWKCRCKITLDVYSELIRSFCAQGNVGLKLFSCLFLMLQAFYLNLKKLNHGDMCRQLDKFSKEIRKQVFIHL